MKLLKVEEVASVSLFDLRLSEGELMLYEECIRYVLQNCDDAQIAELTGCATSEELASFQADLLELIQSHVSERYRLDRYKNDGP